MLANRRWMDPGQRRRRKKLKEGTETGFFVKKQSKWHILKSPNAITWENLRIVVSFWRNLLNIN